MKKFQCSAILKIFNDFGLFIKNNPQNQMITNVQIEHKVTRSKTVEKIEFSICNANSCFLKFDLFIVLDFQEGTKDRRDPCSLV